MSLFRFITCVQLDFRWSWVESSKNAWNIQLISFENWKDSFCWNRKASSNRISEYTYVKQFLNYLPFELWTPNLLKLTNWKKERFFMHQRRLLGIIFQFLFMFTCLDDKWSFSYWFYGSYVNASVDCIQRRIRLR